MKTYDLDENKSFTMTLKNWAMIRSPSLAVNPMNLHKQAFIVLSNDFIIENLPVETEGMVESSWKVYPQKEGVFKLEYGFKDFRTAEIIESFEVEVIVES